VRSFSVVIRLQNKYVTVSVPMVEPFRIFQDMLINKYSVTVTVTVTVVVTVTMTVTSTGYTVRLHSCM
jgi:hypothetical protein